MLSHELLHRIHDLHHQNTRLSRKLSLLRTHLSDKDQQLILIRKREEASIGRLRKAINERDEKMGIVWKQVKVIGEMDGLWRREEREEWVEHCVRLMEGDRDAVAEMMEKEKREKEKVPNWYDKVPDNVEKKEDQNWVEKVKKANLEEEIKEKEEMEKENKKGECLLEEGEVFDTDTKLVTFLKKWGAENYLNPPPDYEFLQEMEFLKLKAHYDEMLLRDYMVDQWIFMFQYDEELQAKIRRQNRFAGINGSESLDSGNRNDKNDEKSLQEQIDEQRKKKRFKPDFSRTKNKSKQVTKPIEQEVTTVYVKEEKPPSKNERCQTKESFIRDSREPKKLNYNPNDPRDPNHPDHLKYMEELERRARELELRNREFEKLKKKFQKLQSESEKQKKKLKVLEKELEKAKEPKFDTNYDEKYMIDQLYHYRRQIREKDEEIERLRAALREREKQKLKRTGQLNVLSLQSVDNLSKMKLKIVDRRPKTANASNQSQTPLTPHRIQVRPKSTTSVRNISSIRPESTNMFTHEVPTSTFITQEFKDLTLRGSLSHHDDAVKRPKTSMERRVYGQKQLRQLRSESVSPTRLSNRIFGEMAIYSIKQKKKKLKKTKKKSKPKKEIS